MRSVHQKLTCLPDGQGGVQCTKSSSTAGGAQSQSKVNDQLSTSVSNSFDGRGPHPGFAKLCLVHAIAGGPAVDIHINDDDEHANFTAAIAGLGYRHKTGFMRVLAGIRHVKVTKAGTAEVLISHTFQLNVGTGTTMIIEGTPSAPSIEKYLTTTECKSDETDAGFIRVIHAAAGAPPVATLLADGRQMMSMVPFGRDSPYTWFPIGVARLQLMIGQASYPVNAINVKAGSYHSVIVVGDPSEAENLLMSHDNHGACMVLEF